MDPRAGTNNREALSKDLPVRASRQAQTHKQVTSHPALPSSSPPKTSLCLQLWDLWVCGRGGASTQSHQATESTREQKINFNVPASSKLGRQLQEVFIIYAEEEADGNHRINLI